MSNLDHFPKSGKINYPCVKYLDGFSEEYLKNAWTETLQIIENWNGDRNVLFKKGKLPFIFKINADTNPEYACTQFEEYIEDNIESLKKFKLSKTNRGEAEICAVPDFEIGRLKEIGLEVDRANEIMIFFKSLMFNGVSGSIQGLKNWNFIFDNKSDSNDLIPAIGKEFDVKINPKNFEEFDRLIERDMSSRVQIVDLRKEVERLYSEDSGDFEKFSKKMEFIICALYTNHPKLLDNAIGLALPESIMHEKIFLILAGKNPDYLKIIKRHFPHLYPDLISDIEKIKTGLAGSFHDPFKVGQETLRGINWAVQQNNFMRNERLEEMNDLLMGIAKNLAVKRKTEAKIIDLKKRKLPYSHLEQEMKKEQNLLDLNFVFDAYNPHILDIFRSSDILAGKLSEGGYVDELRELGTAGLMTVYAKLNEKAEYLGKTNTLNLFSLNYNARPTHTRLEGIKKDFKEYFAADPNGYTSAGLLLGLKTDSNYSQDFNLAINEEEIFSGLLKITKNLSNLGSAYAVKILANWAKNDEKKIAKVIEKLFETDEDYADVDETLRMKLFLFVKETGANIDFVIRKLLCNSKRIIDAFKKDSLGPIPRTSIFDAFDKEGVLKNFNELFNNPKQLTGIKVFRKPTNFDKAKSLQEIESEASIALAEPVYVDMSDYLPAEFKVKLLPVQKTNENDFSWGVEISFRDFKGKVMHEKASGRFENLKFKFGFQGEFRDVFEEISILASHRYFVRDCAEANSRRINERIRELIDEKKSEEESSTVGPRTSGALSVDISDQDKKDDQESGKRLSEKNVKSNALIRKILDENAVTEDEVKDLLIFRRVNFGFDKNIYSRIPSDELIEWNQVGDLKSFILNDDCFVMTTLAHSQAAGFYVKGFEGEDGEVLHGICAKKPTEYSELAHEQYLASGFNPVSVNPYKAKLGVKADGDVKICNVQIRPEGSEDVLLNGIGVVESLNRKIAKKTASPEFIESWVREQIRVYKIDNADASEADLNNFIEEQVKVLADNRVIDAETVKLFLPGKYETQRVFNQGVYKKLAGVFVK